MSSGGATRGQSRPAPSFRLFQIERGRKPQLSFPGMCPGHFRSEKRKAGRLWKRRTTRPGTAPAEERRKIAAWISTSTLCANGNLHFTMRPGAVYTQRPLQASLRRNARALKRPKEKVRCPRDRDHRKPTYGSERRQFPLFALAGHAGFAKPHSPHSSRILETSKVEDASARDGTPRDAQI